MTSTRSWPEQQAIADPRDAVPWMPAPVEVEQPLHALGSRRKDCDRSSGTDPMFAMLRIAMRSAE
jgi:hypothetical protein